MTAAFKLEDQILRTLSDLERRIAALEAKSKNDNGLHIDDATLDGPYGDPLVRHDPRDWTGPSRVGFKFSECETDFLDLLARFFDWRAKKDEESGALDRKNRPRAHYAKKDAALARAWAARLRRDRPGLRPTPAAIEFAKQPDYAPSIPDDAGFAEEPDDSIPF